MEKYSRSEAKQRTDKAIEEALSNFKVALYTVPERMKNTLVKLIVSTRHKN